MPLPKAQVVKRAKKIKLLAMDVDGVLTNGDVLILDSGEELKTFNAKDRLALALLRDRRANLITAWITGRSSNAVKASAEDLGIMHLVQKCQVKKDALEKILREHSLTFEDAAYVGDDIIDLPAMRACGLSICPSDAVSDVLMHSNVVSKVAGGRGVARDALEIILRAQGKWDELISPFLR